MKPLERKCPYDKSERMKQIENLVSSTVESMTKLGMTLTEYETFKELLGYRIQKNKISLG